MKIVSVAATLSALALGVVSQSAFAALPASSAPRGEVTAATPRVGVLIDASGEHWCTASVVHSPRGDLALTAAHCVDDSDTYFVPGYDNGRRPYGTWQVVALHIDDEADVAFLVLDRPVEPVTGAYSLANGGTGEVRMIGYPDTLDQPVTCTNSTVTLDVGNRIECTDFSDGTSGSPWLTPDDEVVGIIGGYEEGGLTADVSYSPVFDDRVEALYAQATR